MGECVNRRAEDREELGRNKSVNILVRDGEEDKHTNLD